MTMFKPRPFRMEMVGGPLCGYVHESVTVPDEVGFPCFSGGHRTDVIYRRVGSQRFSARLYRYDYVEQVYAEA